MPSITKDNQIGDLEPVLEKSYALGVATEIETPKPKKEKDPVAVALGLRVRELRDEIGLKQEDLAEASGLDRRYLSSLEVGSQNCTLRALARVADALGVSLATLFEGVPGYGKPLANRPPGRTY